jgi:hypothetical protein
MLGAVFGLLLFLPLAVALLGTILGLVALVALPIMPAALVVEDCDAGDAITRSAALVLGRPLLVAGAIATSVAALVLGAAIVGTVVGVADAGFAALASRVGGEVGRALASRDPAEIAALPGAARLSATLSGFWISVFATLPAAYIASLAADLSTRLYLLLRARADGEPPATISGHGLG